MKEVTAKLFNWASILDEATLAQARITSELDFVTPHLSLMPDAHLGKGSTVGSVIPTLGAIIPACIGVDIGCGMIAVKTTHKVSELQSLNKEGLLESIASQIPLSAGYYNNKVKKDAEESVSLLEILANTNGINPEIYGKNWRLQLGSLGSGNHFIEISVDEHDYIWLFLHSGSRGVGNKIATHHISQAKKEMDAKGISLPDPDLAYLVEGTEEFEMYINEMQWAQKFAFENRRVMMERVKAAFTHHAGGYGIIEETNCHHNFIQKETHLDQELWVTRKGAISAKLGEKGLIPGSMGDKSYVVRGLGNPQSLNSAPHGAGRVLSRNEAKKTFSLDDLNNRMKDVIWMGSDAFLDEHPLAYKNIDVVMEDAKDLVEITATLKQIINVKGK